jgi:hypothetical protein
MFLADGTPVWEIRHSDGSVSVLGAVVRPTANALSGLETVTMWLKPERHFVGGAIYDQYGRALGYPAPDVGGNPSLPTTARDMTTYAARIVGREVEVGQERIGVIRSGFHAHHPVSGAGAYSMDQVLTFDPPSGPPVPPRSINQALAQPPGTMSLIHADIVIVNGGPARICSAGNRIDRMVFPPCPTSSLLLPGVSDPYGKGYVRAVTGPLFVRAGHSTFTETAVYGGGEGGAEYLISGPLPNPVP